MKLVVDKDSLISVADAIREKGNTTENLEFPQGFVNGINAIESGGGGTEEIENLIDKSEVLGTFEGTITEKVERLIQSADLICKTQRVSFAYDTTIERIDFYLYGGITSLADAFRGATNLKFVKGINTSKCRDVTRAFMDSGIEEFQEPFDLSSVNSSNANTLLSRCPYLKEVRFVPNTIRWNFSNAYSPLLSAESIQSIVDGLATVETAQTLTLHADVKAKLTQTQLDTITNKNWNLA